MKALLDTHAFLWWLDGDPSLSQSAFDYIAKDQGAVLVSAASAWEIATKHRLGKLPRAGDVAIDVAGCIHAQGFGPLSVTVAARGRPARLPSRSVRSDADRAGDPGGMCAHFQREHFRSIRRRAPVVTRSP